MADAPEYLVEIDAHNGSTVVTLRYSTSGYRSAPGDTPASTFYDARIVDPGTIRRSLFAEGKTMGGGEIGYGEIVLSNPDGALDALLTYGFDGRVLVVKRLASPTAALSTAVVVLRATVARLDSNDAMQQLRVQLYDRRLELDDPVQDNVYGGTTTSGGISGHLADGTEDMKDKLKPLVFGAAKNVQPVPVNPFDLIYQVSDGAVSSMTVCDGQVPLNLVGNYATVALLQAAAIPAGKYGTCLAEGLFRLGVETMYQLTADVTEGSTAALRRAGAITNRILTKMGFTGAGNIDSASFTALDTAATQELGIFIDGDMSGSEAIGQILSSVGSSILPLATGPFSVTLPFDLGSSSWALNLNAIEDDGSFGIVANPDTDKGLPAYRVVLEYGRSYTVQAGEAVCPGASSARRGFVKDAVRTVRDEDGSVLTKFPLAPVLTIFTLLNSASAAATEVARRGDLYTVQRFVIQTPVALDDAAAMTLGTTGTITLDRFGCGSGKPFVVIGREDKFADGQAILTLWG